MAFLRYVTGTAALLVSLFAVVSGARAVRDRFLPDWTGPLGGLVLTVMSLACVTVVSEALGSVGLFRVVPLAVAYVAVGLAARHFARTRTNPSAAPRPVLPLGPEVLTPAAAAWANRIAGIAVFVVAAEWLTATVRSFQFGMTAVDAIWYHMPTAARFAESGWTWKSHVIDTTSLTEFYPAGSELLHAVGMTFLHADALSRVLNLGWLTLGLLAAWCIGARYRVAPLALLGGAVLLATPQLVTLESGQALNDMAVTALLLTAVAVVVNAVDFEHGQLLAAAPMVVAALAAGLAAGTKWTALVSVAALTAGVPFLIRRGDRIRSLALWLGTVAVTGSYWYLRNLVQVGSPVPPQRIGLGPIQFEYVHPGISTFSIARHLTDADVWRDVIFPGLRESFGPVWWLVLLLATGGLVAGLAARRDRAVQIAAVVGIACVMSYVLTKQGFNLRFWHGTPRYAAPGLALGLVLLPVALARRPRPLLLATIPVYGFVLVATQLDSRLWRAWWPRSHHIPVVAALVVAFAAGAAAVFYAANRTRLRPRRARPIAIAVALLFCLAAGWALSGYHPTFVDHGISEEAAARLLRERPVRHARIALAGSLVLSGTQYAFYDKGLTTDVQFVAERESDHSVKHFSRCEDFIEAIARGNFQYVVTTAPGPGLVNPTVWLASNQPARRLDSGVRGKAAVFEIKGKLNPARCPS